MQRELKGERGMSKAWVIATSVGLALAMGGGPVRAEVIAYPKNGQTQEQFQMDQYQCHQWAKGQTGVDPTQPAPSTTRLNPPAWKAARIRCAEEKAVFRARPALDTVLEVTMITCGLKEPARAAAGFASPGDGSATGSIHD